ncbi:MAG: hypothetical protein ACO1RT_00290, partial [Planctomycetaceae bacterium]
MNPKRRILFAALIATSATAPADAGCLDWLFKHHATPTTPYAVVPQTTVTPLGPPVLTGTSVAPAPYAAGYAPYVAGYAPVPAAPAVAATAPYAAGYAPYTAGAAPYTALMPSVAAQAPAYAAAPVTAYSLPLNNPSVLTGRPVMQTSATSYMGGPALPPAAVAHAPQAPASWFGHMLGNNYQTSYYGAPTTTYRPVTQVDPTTGAVVTVQQPCTSVTQQVQRSPYTSLQPAPAPAPAPYYGEPTCGSEGARYAPPASYPATGSYGVPSGVSQATAIAPSGTSGTYASPIPSGGSYGGLPAPLTQPNTQPLSGTPSDSAPLAPPQLDAYRPSWNSSSAPVPSTSFPSTSFPSTGSSYPATGSGLQAPPLSSSTAWPDRREAHAGDNAAGSLARDAAATRDRYSDIAPIPAADEYRAPAWGDVNSKPSATTVESGRDRWNGAAPANATLTEPRTASYE